MSEAQKIYWDSSCFICFLNKGALEAGRRTICEDVLRHARNGDVQIWTSTWTIVEVIRPKRQGSQPLPGWGSTAIAAVRNNFPSAPEQIETLWKRYQSNDPAIKLTPEQIEKIQAMFEWEFIKKINLDEPVANKAVELARDYGLRPADSVHAASAIIRKIPILQRWDRDFEKVKSLLTVEEPKYLTKEGPLLAGTIGPTPEEFQ
jgi:predicted nucleic acid-binding protein